MYCGCNPIALSSQMQISEALVRLMRGKAYSAISVSELCRESGVSRQTFYSLFSSMENVVLFTLREKVCSLPHAPEDASSLEQLCHCYSRYICSNRELMKLLVENGISYLLYNSLYDSLLRCRDCCAEPDARRAYAAHFLAGGLTGVVRQYCTAEPPMSAPELSQVLYGLLKGNYLP